MRAALLVGVVLVGSLISGCEPGTGARPASYEDGSQFAPGSYTVRESGVAVRGGRAACAARPGPGSCPDVLLGLRPGQKLYPICQRRGQIVGRNSYWLYADAPKGVRGWVAGWYLDHPSNRLPGVPDCTSARLARFQP